MIKTKRAFSSNITNKNITSSTFQPKDKPYPSSSFVLEQKDFPQINARIIGSELIESTTSDFTEYKIELATDYKKWVIKKRYSEFDTLNNILNTKIPQVDKLFPPKRFFKNSKEIVQERIKCFNKYMNYIFSNINIFEYPEICDFIQIDKKIIELLIKKHRMLNRDEESLMYRSLKKSFNRINLLENLTKSTDEITNTAYQNSLSTKCNSKDEIIEKVNTKQIYNYIIENSDSVYEIEEINSNYYCTLLEYENSYNNNRIDISSNNINNNANAVNININNLNKKPNKIIIGNLVIEEFLRNLTQDNDNKTEILRSFQDFLKSGENWPNLSHSEIEKLFIGVPKIEEGVEGLSGLFQFIGDFENNIILAMGCLDLLVKLISIEYNPEIDIYLEIFNARKISEYQLMKLEDIIKTNKGGEKMTKNAIKILEIIFKNKNKEKFKNFLIKDKNVLQKLKCFVKI